MSVIDEKGRLGGKINIIDLIVILVVLAAVAAVVVLGGRGSSGQAPQHVIYTVEVQGVDEDVFRAILTDMVSTKIGSQEIRVGRNHIVKTTAFELDSGIIISREVVAPEG